MSYVTYEYEKSAHDKINKMRIVTADDDVVCFVFLAPKRKGDCARASSSNFLR